MPTAPALPEFDYIIAGAGCAGLSLAYRLSASPVFDGKTLLIIDRHDKNTNDRTWCFWEKGIGPYEALVYRQWDTLDFYGQEVHQALQIAPYRYKMIRGVDFYRFNREQLQNHPRITWIKGEIHDITDLTDGAQVTVQGTSYKGQWIFSSLPYVSPRRYPYHYLLQHFMGWVIETDRPAFDPQKAVLMDFRIPQQGDTRFCYVLPLNDRSALVEYTLFSPEVLADHAYETVLKAYLKDLAGINHYRILEKEFGVIPMTNMPFPTQTGQHMVHIGTAGGNTKASTGYTFVRIQRQVEKIVRQLENTGRPVPLTQPSNWRYRWMDRIFLNVLAKHRYPADRIFTLFFQHNHPVSVLDFLDEQAHPMQDLRIISSLPLLPFLRALWDEITV